MKEEVFDESEGKIMNGVGSTFTATEVVKMNRELRKMRNRIDTRIRQLERTREEFTVEDILAQSAFGTGKPQFYLLRYINAQIERKQELKKVGMAAAYKSTRSSLAKFISRPDVRMSEVDSAFVRRYEDFLYSNGSSGNTVSYYLRNLRSPVQPGGSGRLSSSWRISVCEGTDPLGENGETCFVTDGYAESGGLEFGE